MSKDKRNYEVYSGSAHKPIKAWVKGVPVEDAARKQLENIASMPFIYRHVAVMPDVHLGRGATVGSVIPTKNAIIPASVGVDIGCFTGDTLVRTLDGKSYPIAELASRDEPFYVFACRPDEQKVIAAKATALKTRTNAPLLEVELDNGRRIRCTPDHRFLLRDGTWCEAKDLNIDASLMPFNQHTDDDGYDRVFQPHSGFSQVVHWIVARSGLLGQIPQQKSNNPGDKIVIHHVEFMEEGKKRDNRPTNLRFMTASEHGKLHREFDGGWQNNNPKFQSRRLSGIERSKQDPVVTAKRQRIGRENFERYMRERPEEFARVTKDAGQRGRNTLISWNKSEAGRASAKRQANQILECPMCGKKIKGHLGMGAHLTKIHRSTWTKAQALGRTNHAVVAVRTLDHTEDVYCLNVPGVHNFALDAGVFVHNCGMCALQLDVKASQLPENLKEVRLAIEAAVPHGFSSENKGHYKGGWHTEKVSNKMGRAWRDNLSLGYDQITSKYKKVLKDTTLTQLGSLGGGNHFIEICLDEDENVWIMLHSGSRGVGNRIGTHFIGLAQKEMERHFIHLPDRDLAYISEGSELFDDYWFALDWAQDYARINRELMLDAVIEACRRKIPIFQKARKLKKAINCHHNYVALENHFGENVYVTRKGAVRAREGDLGIIPGSMGARSFIVRGKGNAESFNSCSHGAGRKMSRGAAKRAFTVEDHILATKGVECRKDEEVIDETPGAYKNILDVMKAQEDLIEVVTTLKQVLCVKG